LTGLTESNYQFSDPRLEELLFRYRARNSLESLTSSEKKRWSSFCKESLFEKDSGSSLVYSEYTEIMEQLRADENGDQELLDQLDAYVAKITMSASGLKI